MSGTIVRTEAVAGRLRRLGPPRRRAGQTDHELVTRAARGDVHALAELYDRHGGLAYAIALRVTRDPTSAQDAVQETFVQLWQKAGTIDPERTSVAAWIVMLARRRAIDLTRREATAQRVVTTAPFDLVAPAAEEHALLQLEGSRVRVAVGTLDPAHRAVIELAYYRGLSQSEIATALEIPLGTVKSRTFTALASLRVLLADGPPTQVAKPVAG